MDIDKALGRHVKVDDVILKRQIGYYASVLVEVDLSKSIPEKVWVKTKYGGFSQRIQMPKVPKFCNHCKVIGHYVAECRVKKKETTQKQGSNNEESSVKRRTRNKNKNKEDITPFIGFDIGISDKEDHPSEVLTPSAPVNLEEGEITSGRYKVLKEIDSILDNTDDFPPLEVTVKEVILEVAKKTGVGKKPELPKVTTKKHAAKKGDHGKKSPSLQPPSK
ncbi:uncharacterized protein LOC113359399 [Papaver somniferum]|uniref:uncharacterized protein LOC113359399 n=1 Tax=Papaver somniferum TaxID=3469 RepID=UPI000E700A7D|nr:uncharacterized protein LOC113359399 [Papaver somniferum]